jgi:hypothetical protein
MSPTMTTVQSEGARTVAKYHHHNTARKDKNSSSNISININNNKLPQGNQEQKVHREHLLPFSEEVFVSRFAIQTYKE